MAKYKKPTYIIIQEAMAERIRFLEDELYGRAYKDIEKLEVQNDFLSGLQRKPNSKIARLFQQQ